MRYANSDISSHYIDAVDIHTEKLRLLVAHNKLLAQAELEEIASL